MIPALLIVAALVLLGAVIGELLVDLDDSLAEIDLGDFDTDHFDRHVMDALAIANNDYSGLDFELWSYEGGWTA